MRVRGVNTSAVMRSSDRATLSRIGSAQTDVLDALARVNVTDWSASDAFAGWIPMGPPGGSVLKRYGETNACVSVSSTDLVIKVAHANTLSVDDDVRGNGIARWVNLAEDWTATIKVSSASNNFDSLPGGAWGSIKLAVVLGGGDQTGSWFGVSAWFNDNGTDWNVTKDHKLPGEASDVHGAAGVALFSPGVDGNVDPNNFWLRLECDRRGFKTSFSRNGSAYTQLAVDEYTDALGLTTAYPRAGLLSPRLVIMASQSATQGTVGDAIAFHVEEIVFT